MWIIIKAMYGFVHILSFPLSFLCHICIDIGFIISTHAMTQESKLSLMTSGPFLMQGSPEIISSSKSFLTRTTVVAVEQSSY